MQFIKYIFETYSDAIIIQTHRHPADAMASWCGIVKKMRTVYSNKIDPQEIGERELKAMQGMVDSVQSFRTSHPELADRFIDVKYNDLVDQPFEAMAHIYKGLNMELTAAQMYGYLASHPQLVAKLQTWIFSLKEHSTTPASLLEFGLGKGQVEDAFGKYIKQFHL